MNPTFSPIVVKGKKPISQLEAALKQLKKPDDEIKASYLYLPVGPRKALRDKWLEMEAEIERLQLVETELKAATALLIECDKLLSEATE